MEFQVSYFILDISFVIKIVTGQRITASPIYNSLLAVLIEHRYDKRKARKCAAPKEVAHEGGSLGEVLHEGLV